MKEPCGPPVVCLPYRRLASPHRLTGEGVLGSPYGLELVDNCVYCKLPTDSFFCGLPKDSLEAFEKLKFTAAYPAGAVLFVEGQSPRGIYMLCKGRVKLFYHFRRR